MRAPLTISARERLHDRHLENRHRQVNAGRQLSVPRT